MTTTGVIRYLDLTEFGAITSTAISISSVVDSVPADGTVIVITYLGDNRVKRSCVAMVVGGIFIGFTFNAAETNRLVFDRILVNFNTKTVSFYQVSAVRPT